jgi:hypothetical protein
MPGWEMTGVLATGVEARVGHLTKLVATAGNSGQRLEVVVLQAERGGDDDTMEDQKQVDAGSKTLTRVLSTPLSNNNGNA